MFGSSKSSSASAAGSASSGLGAFAPSNRISLGGGLLGFDYKNPSHIAAAGLIGLVAWWAYRKFA